MKIHFLGQKPPSLSITFVTFNWKKKIKLTDGGIKEYNLKARRKNPLMIFTEFVEQIPRIFQFSQMHLLLHIYRYLIFLIHRMIHDAPFDRYLTN